LSSVAKFVGGPGRKCLTELATLLVEEGRRRGMGLYRAQAGKNYVVNTARRVRVNTLKRNKILPEL